MFCRKYMYTCLIEDLYVPDVIIGRFALLLNHKEQVSLFFLGGGRKDMFFGILKSESRPYISYSVL